MIDFISGLANAYGSDNFGGAGRSSQDTTSGKAGAAFGDAAATFEGTEKIGFGGTLLVGGSAADETGVGALVGVPAQVLGGTVGLQGSVEAGSGVGNLISSAIQSRSSGPKAGSAEGPGAGKRATANERAQALQENGGKCVFCGKDANQVDHAHPRSRGGDTTPENLQPTCAECNQQKGAKTTQEYLEWKKNHGSQ